MSVHLVTAPAGIPFDIDRARVVAHARRIQELTVAWGEAVMGLKERARAVMGPVLPIGVALSQAVDLGVVGPGLETGQLTTDHVRAAAFPTAPRTRLFRAALAEDAPRFEPADRFQRTCPVGGPRGGKCPGRRHMARWVVDTGTGVWVWAEVCEAHMEAALQRLNSSPDPAPNRGGVLARVFPDVGLDGVYGWARPGWTPLGEPVPVREAVVARRMFRLIVGGEAGQA